MSIKKIIREKKITIIKIRTKVDIKIKLDQILRNEIEKKRFKIKYITIKSLKTKFDIINKKHDISKFFITFKKCFPPKIKGKYFPGNQTKFFFD
jgi:hypothetical protein